MQTIENNYLKEILDKKINELKENPFNFFEKFPECLESDSIIKNQKIKMTIYCEKVESLKIKIIVQIIRPSPTGMTAKVIADGFYIKKDNFIFPLKEDDLYDFL